MKALQGISLGSRVFGFLGALLILTLGSGAATLWYAGRMQDLFTAVLERDVAELQAAEELETALVKQKGYLTYFFLDGNPEWLGKLAQYQKAFEQRLAGTRQYAQTDEARSILNQIESKYIAYTSGRQQVILLYQAGQREEGLQLHQTIRNQFFEIIDLCDRYKARAALRIEAAKSESRAQARQIETLALGSMAAALALLAVLAMILAWQILGPLRRLARETASPGFPSGSGNEMTTLRKRVRGLLENMDQTHLELVRSRELLQHSEKMAVIGKLAADMAHSIRNPMTSINMRLFSLERGLTLSAPQKEDFEVISEEMRRLDNIVRNFLEFSRPHKLRKQKVQVSEIMDNTLQLLEKRLELNGVTVDRRQGRDLPAIAADPELLKEVMVNLVVNACESMEEGGKLIITEEEAVAEQMGRAVLCRVSDTGPGVPPEIRDRVLEPFFSTKEEGTGLGLSIAQRIIAEHGGRLELRSPVGEGATFIITLPVEEEGA